MLFNIFLLIALPCAAFLGGYRATEFFFRDRLVPFPFESYGFLVGLACFFWMLGIVLFIQLFRKKRRKTS